MATKFTRRALAAVVAAPALAAPALAAQAPAAPISAQSADDELKAAREQNRQNADQLAKFPLPMTTEPATHFRA